MIFTYIYGTKTVQHFKNQQNENVSIVLMASYLINYVQIETQQTQVSFAVRIEPRLSEPIHVLSILIHIAQQLTHIYYLMETTCW